MKNDKWAADITATVRTGRLKGGSPAAVHPTTGVLYLNGPVWDTLSESERAFVVAHERGHLRGRTRDELTADRLGFAEYAAAGHSLKALVAGMRRKLDPDRDPAHLERLAHVTALALAHDKKTDMAAATAAVNRAAMNHGVTKKRANTARTHSFPDERLYFVGRFRNWVREQDQNIKNSAFGRISQDAAKGIVNAATLGLANSVLPQTLNEKDRAEAQARAAAEAQAAAAAAAERERLEAETRTAQLVAASEARAAEQRRADAERKKRQMWLYGGIGLAVATVGAVVWYVLAKKR